MSTVALQTTTADVARWLRLAEHEAIVSIHTTYAAACAQLTSTANRRGLSVRRAIGPRFQCCFAIVAQRTVQA